MSLPNVDFFAEVYQKEQPRRDSLFGINDGIEEGDKEGYAYTTTEGEPSAWNAMTKNMECFIMHHGCHS